MRDVSKVQPFGKKGSCQAVGVFIRSPLERTAWVDPAYLHGEAAAKLLKAGERAAVVRPQAAAARAIELAQAATRLARQVIGALVFSLEEDRIAAAATDERRQFAGAWAVAPPMDGFLLRLGGQVFALGRGIPLQFTERTHTISREPTFATTVTMKSRTWRTS